MVKKLKVKKFKVEKLKAKSTARRVTKVKRVKRADGAAVLQVPLVTLTYFLLKLKSSVFSSQFSFVRFS